MSHRVQRANVTRRHARPVVYTPGWYIGQALITAMFIPAASVLLAILTGPLFYQIGA